MSTNHHLQEQRPHGFAATPPHLSKLEVFLEATRAGNYTAAAKRLHVTQSAVSHAIRKLEESDSDTPWSSGVGGGSRSPTEGDYLHRICQRVFKELREAERVLTPVRAGIPQVLTIGATASSARLVLVRKLRPLLDEAPWLHMTSGFRDDLATAAAARRDRHRDRLPPAPPPVDTGHRALPRRVRASSRRRRSSPPTPSDGRSTWSGAGPVDRPDGCVGRTNALRAVPRAAHGPCSATSSRSIRFAGWCTRRWKATVSPSSRGARDGRSPGENWCRCSRRSHCSRTVVQPLPETADAAVRRTDSSRIICSGSTSASSATP